MDPRLPNSPQSVRLGSQLSSVLILSTGAPQGCVLSPLLYTSAHNSNICINFADDTTVVRLIHNNDESAYRHEIQKLSTWLHQQPFSLCTGECTSGKNTMIHVHFNQSHISGPVLSWLLPQQVLQTIQQYRLLIPTFK